MVFAETASAWGIDNTLKRDGKAKKLGGAFTQQETAFLKMLQNDLGMISEEMQRQRKRGLFADMRKVNLLLEEFRRRYTFSNDDVWRYLKNL